MGLKVVIPVAGIGTRLRPHTHTRPKVLVHVAGKPMLGHLLDELLKYDVDEIALVIGYKGEDVKKYVSDNYPFKFHFVEQETMEGLGHAIWTTHAHFRQAEGPLLVLLGDTIFEADFARLAESTDNFIGVCEVEDARRYGVAVVEDGAIKKMVEKPEVPPSNLAIVGIYCFQEPHKLYESLDYVIENDIRTKGELQVTDALQHMLDGGVVMKPFEIDGWHDCGLPESLLATNRLLLTRWADRNPQCPPDRFPGSIIRAPVAIEEGVTIENSIIGPHVTIAEGSVVRDSIISDSILSVGVDIRGALLRESLIADNAQVNGHADKLNIGDGSQINLD